MIPISVDSAFDMHPAADNPDTYFDWKIYQADLGGIAPQQAELLSHFYIE